MEEWEALELTFRALTSFADVSDLLPDRLTTYLLPKFGVRITHAEFRPSQVYPGRQRVCDVQCTRTSRATASSVYTGTLESVVWNAVLCGTECVVPPDVRLCSVETAALFREYLYVALGYGHVLTQYDDCSESIAEPSRETLHRSWPDFNFGRWDSSSDLTTRYATLRALVPFPDGNDYPDPVVQIRTYRDAPQVANATANVETSEVAKAFQAEYAKQAAAAKNNGDHLTWGLGAVAFFGTCGGGRWLWNRAVSEARLWLSTNPAVLAATAESPTAAAVAGRLLSTPFEDAHFPGAMFALARALFCGNVKATYAAKKMQ
ncbi:hypothetical protein V5799_033081 [Amblyomma americanum]|uniref:Uncharacterized protein n=1 Tax=Amblyomma americanum TaxID=6943 RepID=A0AAQ4DPB6_AMBAM